MPDRDELLAEWPDLEAEIDYCLGEGFPADVTDALLTMAYDNDTLNDAYVAWKSRRYDRPSWYRRLRFVDAVEEITGNQATICGDCDEAIWRDDAKDVAYDTLVCTDCLDRNYFRCSGCDEYTSETTTVGGGEYCEGCIDSNFRYCDECDQYYDVDDGHDHDCECEAPHLRFEFPNNGDGTVTQDERVTVELPKGYIDSEGLTEITWAVQREISNDSETRWQIPMIIDQVGPQWQAKRGNFTRRLSSALSKIGVKLTPAVISEIGNIARQHSSDASHWHIEFTRDLNQPPEYFYNDDSCWWQSYYESRCCLKNWGGLAIRCFNDDADSDYPAGRAFIQPLNEDLLPTHDTVNAHAYVVYNSYGLFGGYPHAARIIAHLTGKTYKKIGFDTRHGHHDRYVNGDTGYLVSDEATCADTEDIGLHFDAHMQFDAAETNRKRRAA